MSLRAILLGRESGLPLDFSGRTEVNNASWTMWGGAEACEIWLAGATLEEAQGLLGAGVELTNGMGRVTWRGYVEAAVERASAGTREISLEALVNRARVSYAERLPNGSPGERQLTDWAEDRLSQAVFGIRERVARMGELSREDAETWRDALLRANAWPSIQLVDKAKVRILAGRQGGTERRVSTPGTWLRCKGWMQSLARKTWEAGQGSIGHAAALNAMLGLGEGNQNSLLAQPFTLTEETTLVGTSARPRKMNGATDDLQAQLRADAGGEPGIPILASATLPAESVELDHYGWARGDFLVPVRLAAGQYWLVLGRSNPNGSGFHRLGADASLGYTTGSALAFDAQAQRWISPGVEADLLFRVWKVENSAEILAKAVMSLEDGICGASLEMEGVPLYDWDGSGKDCLDVAREMLALGSVDGKPLRATVEEGRVLRVSEVLAEETAARLDRAGQLWDLASAPLEEGVLPVGEWVEVESAGRLLIRSAGFADGQAWIAGK